MELKLALIDGIEYKYNPEKSYERQGHVYCKACHERIDGDPIDFIGNRKIILTRGCSCVEKERKEEEERERRNKISKMKDICFKYTPRLSECRFENIRDPKRKEVVLARIYVDKFREVSEKNIGLLLVGNVGSGKSYLASAIANAIIERYMIQVRVRNIPEIINEIQTQGFEFDKNDYIRHLCNTPLLILDDFGIERGTEYVLENVYQIINMRYESQKPTIISTNISYNNIQAEKELSLQRIYSRIIAMCVPVEVIGNDKRYDERNVKRKELTELIGR